MLNCVLSFFFATLDINATGVILGKDLLEKNQSLFLWSVRRSPGTLCWRQASYFTELAFIYIYFDPLQNFKSINDFWKPFYKDMKTILLPYVGIYIVDIQNHRMGKIWFIPNSFLKYLDECDMPNCRYWSGEMVNGDVYKRCTLSPCTYWTANNLCDHIYPHMGKGVVI